MLCSGQALRWHNALRAVRELSLEPTVYRSMAMVSKANPSKTPSVGLTDDQQNLPRKVRRAIMFGHQKKEAKNTLKPLTRKESVSTPKLKLLQPHVLSKRLTKLCNEDRIDDAIDLLKTSPLDSQNAPVWNTIIWECFRAKKYNSSYKLYADMKRRGIHPNTRTFQTMFNGLSRIEDWSSHVKQLEHAHSLYESFKKHIESVYELDSGSIELRVDPIASYIKILGDAGLYQKIIEVYHEMNDGPLSPNHFIFTSLFRAITQTPRSQNDKFVIGPREFDGFDPISLWKEATSLSHKSQDFVIDSHLVTAAVSALTSGVGEEDILALGLLKKYYGLTLPDEERMKGTMTLSSHTLQVALFLANFTCRHRTAIHFFEQTLKRPETMGGMEIVDRSHIEEVMRSLHALSLPSKVDGQEKLRMKEGLKLTDETRSARRTLDLFKWQIRQEVIGLNGPKLRPNLSTLSHVLATCRVTGDWSSATEAFDIATGYSCKDFIGDLESSTPSRRSRSEGRNLNPDSDIISLLVLTATETKNIAFMRQSLRIAEHFVDTISSLGRQISMNRLSQSIDRAVDVLVANNPSNSERWFKFAGRLAELTRKDGTVLQLALVNDKKSQTLE